MFRLTENIPVKEGGDAILSCNFGIRNRKCNRAETLLFWLPFARYSGGQMPLAKKWSHCELVFRKV